MQGPVLFDLGHAERQPDVDQLLDRLFLPLAILSLTRLVLPLGPRTRALLVHA